MFLIESIKVVNKKFQNIEFHNERMNKSRKDLFNSSDILDLNKLVSIPTNLETHIYKCRVVYSTEIQKIEFEAYHRKTIQSLTVIECNTIDYRYKYQDRFAIDILKKNIETDDILIVKNGKITDTSFSNIIFFDGQKWLTPAEPLLKGTKREFLLRNGVIEEAEIKVQDLKHFKTTKLINAMIDFDDKQEVKHFRVLQTY